MESNIEKNCYAEFEQNRLLSRKEAAEFLGVKPNTLATWACNQRYTLNVTRIGRLCKYRISDLIAFVSRNIGGSHD